MRRFLTLSGLPTLEHLSTTMLAQFERLLSLGGAVPVAIGTLLAYVVLIGHCRHARG